MKKIINHSIAILLICFCLHLPGLAQTKERSEIPEKYKWDLSDLYISDVAWEEAKNKVAEKIESLSQFKGTLTESASKLLSCLELTSEINQEFDRLFSYSKNKSAQDMRDSKYRAMVQEMGLLSSKFGASASFINPEIVATDSAIVKKFIEEEPGLKSYTFNFNNLMRQKEHILSEKEARILAEAGSIMGAPSSIYSTFFYVELPSPEVKLSTGKTVKLDSSGFERNSSLSHRGDRELVIKTYYDEMNKYRGTLGALVNAKINQDLFLSRTMDYSDCLEMVLDSNNIPVAIYHNLIADAKKNLDIYHRFLNIKKRMLGVDQLKYDDLNIPVVKGVDLNYDVEEATELILESLRPLGNEYTSIVKKAFENQWIDIYPTHGKRSGGGNDDSSYDGHPYILLNYNGTYEDVNIMMHELGHALHTYSANKAQPYPTASYSSFIAEVAAKFNEVLLLKKMLENVKDDDIRLSLLLHAIRRHVPFGQARAAEFELRIHQEVEKGKALTGDIISSIYLDIMREYYGHYQGICTIPNYLDISWATESLLFFRTYHIYHYATAFVAATVLAEKVLAKEKGAVDRYLDLLSAGGSDYPINVLKKAGVDMTTAEPFEMAMEAIVEMMDEVERILDKKHLESQEKGNIGILKAN